jgi:arylsulfatase A-like enzyme
MESLTRRDLIRGAVATVAGLALSDRLSATPTSKPPNIVFIMADDLGYADVGCYGRPDLRTPNIDRIAANGVRFLQAYANSAVCSATRTALITGRYQYRLRLGLEEPLAGNREVGLPPEHPTLPSLLKEAGYSSTLIGKWHMGVLPKFGPLKSGYDHFYGFRGGAVDYFRHTSGEREDFWDDDVSVHQVGYLTQLLGERAVQVVNGYAKSGKPFLLSLHFNAPHWPWEGPADRAESDRIATSGTSGIWDLDGGTQKTYQQMIEAMDAQIGAVLKALDENGLTQNTIIVFTSDNGGERFADTWPFTGRKTELLEGGLRIPAIVSWPAQIPKGQTTDQVSMSMDWVPTLLAAAGSSPDPAFPLDGINLLTYVQGTAPVSRKLFWRYKARIQRAMRDGDFKFLKILDNTFLFNVVEDPMERANLKDRHKDVFRRMQREWYDWNLKMLPEVTESFTHGFTGKELADHYGAPEPNKAPDIPSVPEDK